MTVFGHHTAAELREWLAALDYQIGQMADAYGGFAQLWPWIDRPALDAWTEDWSALRARYASARERAMQAIDRAGHSPLPDSAYPVEDEWQAVHRAVRSNDGPAYAKGDLQDLYNRLAAARGAPIDMSKTPQPRATDVDLGAFQGSGDLIQVGKTAWNALPVSKLAPSTGTKVLLAGGVALGLVLVVRGAVR